MTVLSQEDVRAFIREKWRRAECPQCHLAEWVMPDAIDEVKTLLPTGSDPESNFAHLRKSIPAHWLACGNCGHVMLIASKVIRAWKDAKQGA